LIDDRNLIIQTQKGNLHALGLLYDHHKAMVYRTALAITGDPDASADLLQDAFLRLHRFIDRIDPNRPLEPWLYRITTNLAYTLVKRRNRWIKPFEDIAEWLSNGKRQSPDQQAEDNDEWLIVKKAIASLSVEQRIVVVLFYINDLSILEISDILMIPVGTVKSRLYYGRQALKQYIDSEGEINIREVHYEFT